MRDKRTWLESLWIASTLIGLLLAALGLWLPLLRIPLMDTEQRFSEFHQGGTTRAWIAYASCLTGFVLTLTGHLRCLGQGLSMGGWSILALSCCRILASLINTALKTGVDGNKLIGSEVLVILPGGWCFIGALAILGVAFFCEWSSAKTFLRNPQQF